MSGQPVTRGVVHDEGCWKPWRWITTPLDTWAGRPVVRWRPARLTRGHRAGCRRPGWFRITRHGVDLVRCAAPTCRATYRDRPEYAAAVRPHREDTP